MNVLTIKINFYFLMFNWRKNVTIQTHTRADCTTGKHADTEILKQIFRFNTVFTQVSYTVFAKEEHPF